MRAGVLHIALVAMLTIVSAGALHAQKFPERKSIRAGNRDYEKADYPQSEVDYRRALEKNPDSYEAQFNLGNAFYKQERYDEAVQVFRQLAQDTTRADHIATCHYNAGNALFQQRKFKEALEEYKNSLRKNPADMDAKFNLAYTKKMIEDEEGGGGGGNDNQDQNKDRQGDQNKDNQQQDKGDQDKDNQDKGDDKQDKGDRKQDKGDNKDKPQQGQPPQQQGMTEAEAQQMLDAMQAQEDRTQDKVDEKKKGVVVGSRSGRNW